MLLAIADKLLRIVASFGMAVVLFMLMFFLILFGTLYQVDHGLYQAQKQYFESMFVVHDLGPVSIPLVGGYLLIALLAVNLIIGGMVYRKVWRRPGVFIVHIGVLMLIASAAVTYHFSERGNMRLYPGQQSDEYSSYHEWNVEIGKPAAGADLYLIPDTQFADLGPRDQRSFSNADLPFDIELTGFTLNGVPQPVAKTPGESSPVVDDWRLITLPSETEAEMNVPGIYVSATDKTTGEKTEGILWGMEIEPLTVKSGDLFYTIGLDRKRFRAPFVVRVDKFDRKLHPGTNMPASFEAEITKIESGQEERYRIWMNHPLRHKGLTFFQASWGPGNARPGEPLFTVFEVVRNPADQGPLVATIVISIGFLIHFTQKLIGYMRAESRRRAA